MSVMQAVLRMLPAFSRASLVWGNCGLNGKEGGLVTEGLPVRIPCTLFKAPNPTIVPQVLW